MSPTQEAHPGPDELSAWLDGSISVSDRARIEAHVARCDDCRRDVVEVLRVVKPRADRRVWPAAAALAAAAVVAVLVFAPGENERAGRSEPVLRGPETTLSDETPAPAIVHPADAATTDSRDVAFTWRASGRASSYRLTLTDEDGDVVWSASTADTVLALPADSALAPGGTYFWYVDALLPDGRSLTSGVHEFRTSR